MMHCIDCPFIGITRCGRGLTDLHDRLPAALYSTTISLWNLRCDHFTIIYIGFVIQDIFICRKPQGDVHVAASLNLNNLFHFQELKVACLFADSSLGSAIDPPRIQQRLHPRQFYEQVWSQVAPLLEISIASVLRFELAHITHASRSILCHTCIIMCYTCKFLCPHVYFCVHL
jgi:hypothetical protein